MLTFSNWFTEMNGNRYHFATRFAKDIPVFFVQVDGIFDSVAYEKTKIDNITVVKLNSPYNYKSFKTFLSDLFNKGHRTPLFWVYNPYFEQLLNILPSPDVIYHATEDYFCDDFINDHHLRRVTENIIKMSFLTIAVSQGVKENISRRIPHKKVIVSENGCDFKAWSKHNNLEKKPIVVYQGGIHAKIDFGMLHDVIASNPEIQFKFFGEAYNVPARWNDICKLPNVRYAGKLELEELIRQVSECKVGIIPFVQNDWIVKRSFPLKFYEYLAAGLHIISTPIDSLPEKYSNTSATAAQFSENIKRLIQTPNCFDEEKRNACALADYDNKFKVVIKEILATPKKYRSLFGLILVDDQSSNISQINELQKTTHISFKRLDINFFSTLNRDHLMMFDIILIDSSVGLQNGYINDTTINALSSFNGVLTIFIHEMNAASKTVNKILRTIKPAFLLKYSTEEDLRRLVSALDNEIIPSLNLKLSSIFAEPQSETRITARHMLKRILVLSLKKFLFIVGRIFGINEAVLYEKIKTRLTREPKNKSNEK